MSDPRFTVVMAAYNATATIESAIRSVLHQREQDFEIVVVDDGSSDDTAARAAALGDSRVRVVRRENGGPSAARNAGIAAARAPYLSFLDADDLWLPAYLDVMGDALDRHEDAAFAYTDAWVLDDHTGRIRRRSAMGYQRPPTTELEPRALFLALIQRNFVYTSVTARRSALDEVGGYDESLRTSEDWDLWLRIARSGGRAVRPPGLLAVHRIRAGSLASDAARMTRTAVEVQGRLAADRTLDDEATALAARELERSQAALRRLEERPPTARVRARLGKLKGRVMRRRLWLDRPPADVESTLRAVGER